MLQIFTNFHQNSTNFIIYFEPLYFEVIKVKLKKGDIVGRISYNNDILFTIDKIIKTSKGKKVAILKGLAIRIEADAPLSDLIKFDNELIRNSIKKPLNSKRNIDILGLDYLKEYRGKILHLDGDRKYSEKSARYYRQEGLNAIVKNIPEYKQEFMVKVLLEKYKPDILVITGHDSMLKNGTNINNIYNYRNSKYFINTVREARKWERSSENLVIFAGACQSYFEAIMNAGADFASSPGRVLIDFMDPLIVAKKIATTENTRYVTINDISEDLSNGTKGISGGIVRGKKKKR